ncbi:hypothetical protein, partial [Chitinophaga sancti]|uniref:hypothetical protein n=1 Tax=Chitinophaga sancti TaxID=1004 RepID=UPI003F7A8DCA
GSALRVENPQDLDIAIRVERSVFETLSRRFERMLEAPKMLDQIGENGKIGGLLMFKDKDRILSFTQDFSATYKAYYKNIPVPKLDIGKVQISIIAENSNLDLSPYLKL